MGLGPAGPTQALAPAGGGGAVWDGVPGDGRRGREHGVVGDGERHLEREVQEVEGQPEISGRFRGQQGHGPGGTPSPGNGVRGRERAYHCGVVGEAGGPPGARLPQGAQLKGRCDAVQLGADPAAPGGYVFRSPVDLQPGEGSVQGGGDLGFRFAPGCPDLGVEVPRHEVQAGGHPLCRDPVAHPSGDGQPVIGREVHIVYVARVLRVRVCQSRREAVPRGVDPAVGHHVWIRGDDSDPSARPQQGVVLVGPWRLGGEDLGSREEASPYCGRRRGPMGLL